MFKNKSLLALGVVFVCSLLALFLFVTLGIVAFNNINLKKKASPGELTTQVKALKGQVNSFISSEGDLKNKFNQEQERANQLQEKLKVLASQNEILARELRYSKANLEITQSVRQRLSQVELSLMSLNLDPRKENELRKELAKLYDELNSIDGKIPSLIKYNKAYKNEAESLVGTLEKKEKELSILNQKVKDNESRFIGLRKQIDSLSSQLDGTIKEKLALERRTYESSGIAEDLRLDNSKFSTEIKRLQSELDEAKKKSDLILVEKDSATKEIKTKQEEIKSLNNKIEDFTREVSLLTDRKSAIEKESAKLSEQVKSEQQKNDSYQAEKGLFVKKNEDLQKEIILLGGQKSLVETESGKLSNEVKFQQDKIDSLVKRNQELENKLSSEISSQQDTVNSLIKKNKDMEKEISLLKDQKKLAEVEIDRLSRDIKSQQDKFDVLARNNKDLVKRLSSRSESAAWDAQRLSKEIESQQERIDLLSKKNQELEKALLGKSDSIMQEANKYADLVKKNQVLEKELNSLHSQLDELNKSHSALKEESKKNQPFVIAGQTESEKLSQAYTQLENMQIKVGEMAKESANLRQDYVFIQLEREKIKDELERTRAKLAELENKFNQMGNILGPAAKEAKKVEVELIPDNKLESN